MENVIEEIILTIVLISIATTSTLWFINASKPGVSHTLDSILIIAKNLQLLNDINKGCIPLNLYVDNGISVNISLNNVNRINILHIDIFVPMRFINKNSIQTHLKFIEYKLQDAEYKIYPYKDILSSKKGTYWLISINITYAKNDVIFIPSSVILTENENVIYLCNNVSSSTSYVKVVSSP